MNRAKRSASPPPQRQAAVDDATGRSPAQHAVDRSPAMTMQRQRWTQAFGATTQRRSFETALGETGVTSPGNFSQTAGAGTLADGTDADLVAATNLQESASLERALNQAASRAAKVGAAANAIRANGTYAAASGPNFVAYNSGATPNGLEPFIYRVKVPYRKGDKKRQIELDWQQANGFRGYIVRQKDTGDTGAATISANAVTNAATAGQADTFNMAHANTGGAILADYLDQDGSRTRETNEARIDARTKLAGEGARWLLVRNNSGKITDESRIWTQANGKVYWVSFRTLWLSWLDVFGSAYDIPDAEVATHLVNNTNWADDPTVVKRNRWAAKTADIEVHR